MWIQCYISIQLAVNLERAGGYWMAASEKHKAEELVTNVPVSWERRGSREGLVGKGPPGAGDEPMAGSLQLGRTCLLLREGPLPPARGHTRPEPRAAASLTSSLGRRPRC